MAKELELGLVLRTQPPTIRKLVLKTFASKMAIVFEDMEVPLRDTFSGALATSIRKSGTYKSVINGVLKGELGVVDGQFHLEAMIKILQSTIQVRIKKPVSDVNRIAGSITVMAVPTDLSSLLNSNVGTYFTRKGVEIKWLNWLLTQGNDVVIDQYIISFENPSASRTGTGMTMEKSEVSRGWKVPSRHAGRLNNNFITRAFDDAGSIFERALEKQMRESLGVLRE